MQSIIASTRSKLVKAWLALSLACTGQWMVSEVLKACSLRMVFGSVHCYLKSSVTMAENNGNFSIVPVPCIV